MQYHFLLLLASVAMATALALPSNSHIIPGTTSTTPGRVLTKTYTYDSTKDLDDPCNPITGDPEKCLRSMEELAPSPNAPSPERFYVAEELDVAQKCAEGSDFDTIYERRAKKLFSDVLGQ
ncbi:hypothetical protein BGX38DRAFT_1151457 [Terfezia claveryi]|nr:hypothetical protein BGX38DRAFT_1151457 [Terfezia claveryi]